MYRQLYLFFLPVALLWQHINCLVFTHPSELVNEGSYVVLGLTLMRLDSTPFGLEKWGNLSNDFKKMVHSLLYHSPDTNIHFVIISDRSSQTGLLLMSDNYFILNSNFRCE